MAKSKSPTAGMDFAIAAVNFEILTRENELGQQGMDDEAIDLDRTLANKRKYLDALEAKRERHIRAANTVKITRTNKHSGVTQRRECCVDDLGFFEDQGFEKVAENAASKPAKPADK